MLSSPSDLDSLEGLDGVQTIGKRLTLSNTSLKTLDGLRSLNFVGGSVKIEDNRDLCTEEIMTWLEGVQVLGEIEVNDNRTLCEE